MDTVLTYTAVISDPNPEHDGTDIYWFATMPQEFEEFLAEMGWTRSPRTDRGAAGVWHRTDMPRTMTVHRWYQCWNMLCVNDEHEGDEHVDATGRPFYATGPRWGGEQVKRDYLD
jgi:hypothetical protein